MTLIRQVVRDLVKDAGWVIFYGFLTAMSIMAFVLVGLSYQHVASQNDAIRRFTQNDVSMVRVKDLSSLMTAADRETTAQPVRTGSGRQQSLVELFQKHDNLGSLVLLPGIGGYQQTIVYVGAYTRLTAFPFPAGSDAPIAAVSPDCAGDEGKTLRIGDHECTVTVVPSDMDVYHPLHYIPPASENLKKTLYVFSPSCEDALSLAAFPHVSVDMFIPAKLEIIKASEITPKEVRWLWYPYIPFGKVTLLQGDPGDGKSKLMLSLAALLSKGAPLPFDDEDEQGEPMTVIYQTTEDDADDTVVPRFNSAGGDGERLIFIKEDEKSLTFGDDRIREAVEKYNAKLLILDPMSSYIGDTCSMNNANETRAEFNHLIAVAKDTGCAIVIIAHMNKAKDTSPLYRTNGSIDIAGAARSILAVTRTANKQNPAERYLVQVKSNLAPMGSAILFEVADKGVNFLDELELSAEDAFSASAPRMGRPNAREEAATDFIRSLLAGGRRLASDCEAKLEAAGFKKSTYKKSKKKAGVRSVKDGFLWYWTLPEVEKPIENGQEVTDEDDLPI